MPNSCTVLVFQETHDGKLAAEVFHWENRDDGETVPPNGDIRPFLARLRPTENKFSLNKRSAYVSRSAAVADITTFFNNKYPNVPA